MAGAGQPMEVEVIAKLDQFQKGFEAGIKQLDNFAKKAKAASAPVDEFAKKSNDAGQKFAGLGNIFAANQNKIQNASYQIQDFAVQLASGTNATRAMSQQLPQLLSGFGVFGALAGTAAAVLIPLVANMFAATEKVKPLKEAMSSLTSAVGDYQKSLKDVQAAMNDGAWANTAFGKMVTEAQKALAALNLQKVKSEFAELGSSIAGQFGQSLTTMQKLDFTLGTIGTRLAGINPNILKTVDGLKQMGNAFLPITKAGENFTVTVTALRNMGIEANTAARLTRDLMNALKSGDMPAIASAAKAVADAIMAQGQAAGGATPQQIALAQALNQLVVQAGGVQQSMTAAAGSIAAIANAAANAIPQIMGLVQAMSQLNFLGAAGGVQKLYSTFTQSGAGGAAMQFVGDFSTKLKEQAAVIKAQGEAVKDTLDPMRAYGREQARLKGLVDAGVISQEDYNQAIANLNDTLDGGGKGGGKKGGGGGGKKGGSGGTASKLKAAGDAAKKAGDQMKAAESQAQEFADALKQVAESAAQGVVDALFSIADGSKSAKEAFTELAKSLLKQVAQMIMQLLILKPLMGMFGGGFGGIGMGGGLMSMSRMMPSASPQIGSYDGFRMSPAAMTSIRSSAISVGSGNAHQVAPMNVTVNNNSSANVKTRKEADALYIDIIEDVVSDRITRGGNKIDAAMQRAFGARRVGY